MNSMTLGQHYPQALADKLTTLVCLHGWGMHSAVWTSLFEQLQTSGLQLISLDLPGFGCQHELASDYRLDDVLDYLDEHLPERSVLCGWSLGAMLGLAFAARYPARIEGLICLAANPSFVQRHGEDPWPAAMPAPVFNDFKDRLTADADATLKRFCYLQSQGDAEPKRLLRSLSELLAKGVRPDQHSQAAALDLLGKLDLRASLAKITQPLLWLQGAEDALVPRAAAAAIRNLAPRQARIELVPEASHALPLSHVSLLARRIRDFVEELNNSEKKAPADAVRKRDVARSFSKAAPTYDGVAELQRRIGDTLVEALPDSTVNSMLDLGCGTGHFCHALVERYPQAFCVGLDIAEGMLQFARQQWPAKLSGCDWLAGDAEALPLADACMDLIFSSLALQWCQQPEALFAELARVLRPGGTLLIATLGPGTLRELQQAWQQADQYTHVNRFTALSDLQREALTAGLVLRNCHQQHIERDYDQLQTLTRELKSLGAHNVNQGRPKGLTGRQRIRRFKEAYEAARNSRGKLPASYEVIYLHLQKPAEQGRAGQEL